jgi:hypothetical protein
MALAWGLFVARLVANWAVERAEAARGRTLMGARYVVAAVWFAVVPALGAVGLAAWAWAGFRGR